MKLTIIAGARPNFIKIAPLIKSINQYKAKGISLQYRLVHTGQHYDAKMSDTFFEELNIPHPHVNLECGGGSQAEQTAAIMVAFEKELISNPADLVVVVGDVTSTMACSIVAKKLNTKVAHVEAGIRSFDYTMPEEINRIVTDSLTDYFFTTTTWAGNNLLKSGVSSDKIFFVGNIMIDTLMANRQRLSKPAIWDTLSLEESKYLVMTLHRPANVDESDRLKKIIETIVHNINGYPIIFPVHPRTAKQFAAMEIHAPNMHTVEPMGYLNFNYLVSRSKAVITDSGGITEEATVFGVPCITLRNNTERPETCEIGTNELVGTEPDKIEKALQILMAGHWKKGSIPELWDGQTAERIVEILIALDGK
ncbi:MAG TPA: UDP-N-acetylglucosamine 2-epimerase (non-hydrolyzing) [Ferruginibacter sp.]|nr:UDP-N-acetylglucosamine 2-epimerase (non-hydrolyzing) [Ferruginibacter sp.]HMP19649.1 UDP-N-acetylglucosamine 2-epimerase (non-hydrolyzing) [Ferruginibacter sp.]